MCEVIKNDVGFIVAFFGALQIRMIQIIMVVCMLLWVTSFVDSGYLKSEDEAKSIYQNLFIFAVFGTCFLVPWFIKMSDNWHLGWCIGVAFLLRSIVFIFGFSFLKTPDSIWTFIMTLGMLSTTGVQSISVETFFSKIVPSDISGTMRGLYNFFGQVGVLIMTLLSGYLYDFWGPSSPFVIIGICDFLLAILTITLCCFGRINPNKR